MTPDKLYFIKYFEKSIWFSLGDLMGIQLTFVHLIELPLDVTLVFLGRIQGVTAIIGPSNLYLTGTRLSVFHFRFYTQPFFPKIDNSGAYLAIELFRQIRICFFACKIFLTKRQFSRLSVCCAKKYKIELEIEKKGIYI